MVFPRDLLKQRGRSSLGRSAPASLVHPTYALRPLLRRLRRIEHAQVLDLGAAEDVNLEFFSRLGGRVSVEDLIDDLPRPLEKRTVTRVRRARAVSPPPSLLGERRPEEELFDLVLCWDLLDLLSPEAAAGLVRELRSRLRPRGMVWALFESRTASSPGCLRRFRILGEESLEHRLQPELPVARLVHPNRDILAMFDGFEVVCSTFLRVGLREMLFARAQASSV